MAITAAQVNELRKRTGLGMMECKKALQDVDGDVEKAIDELRKKGVKAKVAEREAGEGRVASFVNEGRNVAVAIEIKCNTDFTAKSDEVGDTLELAGQKLLADPTANLTEDPAIKDKLVATSQRTGENVQLGRVMVLSAPAGGKVGAFQYTVTNKIAALVSLKGEAGDELLRDVGLHLVAFQPTALAATKEGLPQDLVAKERQIAVEQATATGKPQEIAEKIAEGKLNSFYKERVLPMQEFINPEKFKGSVGEMLQKHGTELVDFKRLEVGVE
ncbi:MAG: translation elongation factor Ts [Phycisphaerae bacterium]